MKKTMFVAVVVLATLMVFGVSIVFAQSSAPYAGNGPIILAADAHLPRAQLLGSAGVQNGGGMMHDYVEQALAAKLGLTEAQVEEQLADGKSIYQIALDNGIKQEDLTDFLNGVHQHAFAAAVKDGVMAQEQADWMLQRMQNRGGYGTGNCLMYNGQGGQFNRGGGRMRGGFGWQNQQTNP